MALWSNTDAANSKPKYLSDADKAVTFGVDVAEQAAEDSQNVNPQHAGWVKRTSYTDAQGNVRTKLETLVAMGSMTSDLEDTVMQDLDIVIGTQPVNRSVTAPAATTFAVVATSVPSGGTLGYQWQISNDAGATWNNVTNGGVYSTATTATLNISNTTGLTGKKYRVKVDATGATTVYSTEVTLTVA
jgi:hypothetical protein